MAGVRRAEADARLADVYTTFERLHERRTQLAGTLSGGEQQMLAIARGLIMKPRLLMIDEMSQGLAPTIVQSLFNIVRSLPEQGVSVLIVEQFVTHALAVATRAYVLEKGEVAFNGKAAELARDESFVKGSYLGEGGDAVGDLRVDDTADLPLHADGLLDTIKERAEQEGRNAADVLLDLLRDAIEHKRRQHHPSDGRLPHDAPPSLFVSIASRSRSSRTSVALRPSCAARSSIAPAGRRRERQVGGVVEVQLDRVRPRRSRPRPGSCP